MKERVNEGRRYVIIGNSTAATAAVEAIRTVDRGGSITLVSEEPYHTYSRPLISYYLSGQVEEEQMLYRPRDFYRRNGVDIRLGTRAVKIDTNNKQVFLTPASGRKDPEEAVGYDRLMIATGSRPAAPPIPGLSLSGVHNFYTLDDIRGIKANLKSGDGVVVLGAGLIGMKAAEALNKLGCRVSVVEMADRVLSTILDREASAIIQSWMEEHGIRFYLSQRAAAITGDEKVDGVRLEDGNILAASMVIVATGVRPNAEIARSAAIEVRQGILVNEYQETSVPDIYCAGDVCEGYDPLYNRKKLTPILPSAYHQGRIAGLNMAGETHANTGLAAFNSTTFFGLPVCTMGLSVLTKEEGERYSSRNGSGYRSLVFKGETLAGGIFINSAERAGIFLQLIREKTPVRPQKDFLLQAAPRLIDFPGLQL